MTEPYLHYDVTGTGPLLLLIPGGAGHPMGLGPVTEALAGRFTVVTYDPWASPTVSSVCPSRTSGPRTGATARDACSTRRSRTAGRRTSMASARAVSPLSTCSPGTRRGCCTSSRTNRRV